MQIVQGQAAAAAPRRVARNQAHRLVERGERLLVAADRIQGLAAAAVPLCVARFQPHRLVERRERILVAAVTMQGQAAAQGLAGIFRIRANAPVKRGQFLFGRAPFRRPAAAAAAVRRSSHTRWPAAPDLSYATCSRRASRINFTAKKSWPWHDQQSLGSPPVRGRAGACRSQGGRPPPARSVVGGRRDLVRGPAGPGRAARLR